MTDQDLLRWIMFLAKWNQTALARFLDCSQANISRVVKGKQNLRKYRRQKAEELLTRLQRERKPPP